MPDYQTDTPNPRANPEAGNVARLLNKLSRMKQLESKVFPSEEQTIWVEDDPIYGGAHYYQIEPCLGFNNGETDYMSDPDDRMQIQFIQKNDDGNIIPGLQSEQIVFVLLDRHKKLNARFPSDQNKKMIEGLQMFIDACEERVKERIARGVMGELKK